MAGADNKENRATVRRMTKPVWTSTDRADLAAFIRNLHVLLPAGAFLVVEGTRISEDVQKFLREQQPDNCPSVELDTTWPVPELFHLPVTENALAELANLARSHAQHEICDHLKAYKDGQEIMAWYDVDCTDTWGADASILEGNLQKFCRLVRCKYRAYKPESPTSQ
jgi:hypothetical protein